MEPEIRHFCWVKVVRTTDSGHEQRQKTLEAAVSAAKIPAGTRSIYQSVSSHSRIPTGGPGLMPPHPTSPSPVPSDEPEGGVVSTDVRVRVVTSSPWTPPHPTGSVDPKHIGFKTSIEVHVEAAPLPPPHPTGSTGDSVRALPVGSATADSGGLKPPHPTGHSSMGGAEEAWVLAGKEVESAPLPTPHPPGFIGDALLAFPGGGAGTDSGGLTPPHPTGHSGTGDADEVPAVSGDQLDSSHLPTPHPIPIAAVEVARIAPAGGGSAYAGSWWQYRGSPMEADFNTLLAPVPGDRDAAYRWIESEEGLAWREDAVALKLICLSIDAQR